MQVKLAVTQGPHKGKEFAFDGHDCFTVGRSRDSHFQLSSDDPYFSRRHFVIEVNPPRCRLLDLKSRNGVRVNGQKVAEAELHDGDEITAGHTVFQLIVSGIPANQVASDDPSQAANQTIEYTKPGMTLAGYDLIGDLGRGSAAKVFKARRQSDGVMFAVKVYSPFAGSQSGSIDRFIREATILTKLRHVNIVACHEAGRAGGMIFIVLDLIDGPNSDAVVKERGPFSTVTAVRLICHVLAGLEHAHENGFVHRDVKPANVLIGGTKGSHVGKLTDFGLARAYEASRLSGVTLQGETGGTPAYMAPEQVTHFREVQPAADQFSAAATLYRLLTGQYCHDLPKRLPRALIHIATSEPIPMRKRRPDLPEKLSDVVHHAMRREPEERFPSVAAFRRALLPFI